jgi:poly(3-hydroxybutyrate) depolymerase
MTTKRQLVGLCLLLGSCLAFAQPVGPATGAFRITETLAGIAGEDAVQKIAAVIAPDEPITWEIYVPEHYDAEQPPGLMVYISPTPSGEMPRGWDRVMNDHNLIWVAANKSGNSEIVARRAILAQISPMLIGRDYSIDRERVYITGLRGCPAAARWQAWSPANMQTCSRVQSSTAGLNSGTVRRRNTSTS